jgi:hypothetical protein
LVVKVLHAQLSPTDARLALFAASKIEKKIESNEHPYHDRAKSIAEKRARGNCH